MPELNFGSVINRLGAYQGEYYDPYLRIQCRCYLAYAKLTSTPQLSIPLYLPARATGKEDSAFIMGSEVVYSARSWLLTGATMTNSGKLKVASSLAETGYVVATASAGGVIVPGFTLTAAAVPGSTLSAPLGSNTTGLPQSIFAVTGADTAVAAAVGVAVGATAADALDTAIRKEYSTAADRNQIIVELCTYKVDPGVAITATTLGLVDEILMRLKKGA